MRRIADLYPGEAKTDGKDAAVIADAARTLPHTLRSLELTDGITADSSLVSGDLARRAGSGHAEDRDQRTRERAMLGESHVVAVG